MHLSRYQKTKKVFNEIGEKYKLPDDIIFYLYKKYKDDIEERNYHSQLLYDYYNAGNKYIGEYRSYLLIQIKIYGKEDYLMVPKYYMADGVMMTTFTKAMRKDKIKYLNDTDKETVLDDYYQYGECIDPPLTLLLMNLYN